MNLSVSHRLFSMPLFTNLVEVEFSEVGMQDAAYLRSLATPWGPETSRLLKIDHNISHVRMKMRLGGCVAFSQNTDTDTGAG
jgi:hypothetical protein